MTPAERLCVATLLLAIEESRKPIPFTVPLKPHNPELAAAQKETAAIRADRESALDTAMANARFLIAS